MVAALLIMLGLFAAGVPIALALGMAALPTLVERNIPLIAVPQVVFDSLDSFALMALPLYVLAGRLMQVGGIAQRLVGFAIAIVGYLPGGLAASVVLTSMLFATISGSSAATAAAIGSVLIPEMEKQKYPRPFAASVVASSGELGVIIPPSTPMVIYAVITGASITQLFVAGLLPGLLIGLSLIATTTIVAAVKGYGVRPAFVFANWLAGLVIAFRRAFLSLLMPVIILGGIYGGVFTPTEASVAAVFYALIVGMLIYREVRPADILPVLKKSVISSAVIMFIIGNAGAFAWLIDRAGVPEQIGLWLRQVLQSPEMFLLGVNAALFVIGMFIETSASIIVLAPILVPVAIHFGIDPVHFGMIMVVNLALGMITPPFGVNLFAACTVAKISLDQIVVRLLPFVSVVLGCLMVITYFPPLSLFLRDLVYR
jgi:tripartite ATP-independent transporter DctM subunit